MRVRALPLPHCLHPIFWVTKTTAAVANVFNLQAQDSDILGTVVLSAHKPGKFVRHIQHSTHSIRLFSTRKQLLILFFKCTKIWPRKTAII